MQSRRSPLPATPPPATNPALRQAVLICSQGLALSLGSGEGNGNSYGYRTQASNRTPRLTHDISLLNSNSCWRIRSRAVHSTAKVPS